MSYTNQYHPGAEVHLGSLYNYQLSRNVGAEGLVILTILVQASAGLRESSHS